MFALNNLYGFGNIFSWARFVCVWYAPRPIKVAHNCVYFLSHHWYISLSYSLGMNENVCVVYCVPYQSYSDDSLPLIFTSFHLSMSDFEIAAENQHSLFRTDTCYESDTDDDDDDRSYWLKCIYAYIVNWWWKEFNLLLWECSRGKKRN